MNEDRVVMLMRIAQAAGLCLALWGAMAATATAQSYQVTANGTTYNVTIDGFVDDLDFTTANNTSNANGQLTALNSWFGNEALAQGIATAFTFSDFPALPAGVTNVFFAHSVNGGTQQVSYFDRGDDGSITNPQRKTTSQGNGDLAPSEAWAFGTAEVVPEIDGPVLAQALFVLFALYAVIAGRRRRAPPAA